jgi:hypothetical protein
MKTKAKIILHDHNDDGLDRRGFRECMAWAGTGMLWPIRGGNQRTHSAVPAGRNNLDYLVAAMQFPPNQESKLA